jgi:uncharacterized damage-inducible protein DinB
VSPNRDESDPRPSVPPTMRVPRPNEAELVDERTMARGWLTHLRESTIFKLEELTDEQLRRRPSPSANSLGGIVMHLGFSERLWFRVIFAGEQMDLWWTADRYAPTFVVPDGWSARDVERFYRAENQAADAVIDAAPSLDQASQGEMRPTNLRWVLSHMVEETARHVGHMDLTRELLDGRVGR